MSMLYDPVTREFKARESHAAKPQGENPALMPPLPSEEGRQRHKRRFVNVRRQRRNRELLTWCVFIVVAGSLLWMMVWAWGKWHRGGIHTKDNSPNTRFWQSINE